MKAVSTTTEVDIFSLKKLELHPALAPLVGSREAAGAKVDACDTDLTAAKRELATLHQAQLRVGGETPELRAMIDRQLEKIESLERERRTLAADADRYNEQLRQAKGQLEDALRPQYAERYLPEIEAEIQRITDIDDVRRFLRMNGAFIDVHRGLLQDREYLRHLRSALRGD